MSKEIDPKIIAVRLSNNALTLAGNFEFIKKKRRYALLSEIEADAELLKKF